MSSEMKKNKMQNSIQSLTWTAKVHSWALVGWWKRSFLQHIWILGDNFGDAVQYTNIILIVHASADWGLELFHLAFWQRMVSSFRVHHFVDIGGVFQLNVRGQSSLLNDAVDLANERLDLLEQCVLGHC